MWYVTIQRRRADGVPGLQPVHDVIRRPATGDMARRMLPLELDPPDHNKYRSLLAPLFSPKAIDRLEHSIRETCDSILDDIIDRGRVRLPDDFARTLPGTVFMKLMGLPMERREEFFQWEEAFFHGGHEDRRASGKKIEAAIAELVAQRQVEPQEDLMSMLVHGKFVTARRSPMTT